MRRTLYGMTLLELLMVLGVVGILALVTVPYFGDYFAKLRTQTASETLYHDFQKARSEAIQQGKAVAVVFQTGASWCYGVTTATTCNCLIAANCDLGQTSYTSYKNTALSITGFSTGAGVGDVTFSPSRGDVNRIGTATFTGAATYIVRLDLNRMGFPGICSNNVGGYSAC